MKMLPDDNITIKSAKIKEDNPPIKIVQGIVFKGKK
jgi:hypothetical protein